MTNIQTLCNTLKEKGFKLTPARKIILAVFCHSQDRFLNAGEIYDQVRLQDNKINYSTVYRNLEILVGSGLIEKSNFGEGAKFILSTKNTHSHHMICKSCHKTEALPYCPLEQLENSLKDTSEFFPTDHRIEIYGYCKECRKKQ